MYKKDLELTKDELKKFKIFYKEHTDCNLDEVVTLANIYNIKLVFNISKDSLVKTCLCSACGSEQLLTDPEELINENSN